MILHNCEIAAKGIQLSLKPKIGYKHIKRIFAVFSVLLLSMAFAKPQIIICKIIDHQALNEEVEGIKEYLNQKGYTSGDIKIYTANGKPDIAISIARQLKDLKKSYVVIGLGTTMAQSLYGVLQKIHPVVFSAVTDPKEAKLSKDNCSGNDGIAGVSDAADFKDVIKFFQTQLPNVKKIGVIYNSGETNSNSAIKHLQDAINKSDLKLLLQPVVDRIAVKQAAQALGEKGVDAYLVTHDNTAVDAISMIADVAAKRSLPVVAMDSAFLNKGADFAVSYDRRELGKKAIELALEINDNKIKGWPIIRGHKAKFYKKGADKIIELCQ